MSYRAWIIALAIGLITASAQAQEQKDSASDRANQNQQTSDSLPSPFPVQIIEDDEATKSRERREQEAEQREKDDLVAQQSMEVAAHSAKWAAWLSFVVVTVGTILLIWTLILTRQANRAAQDAVEVTREVARDQTRAYIHVQKADLSWGDSTGKAPRILLTAVNSGNTPARWFEITSRAIVGREIKAFPRAELDGCRVSRWTAFRSQDTQTLPGIMEEEDFSAIQAGYGQNVGLTIFGLVRYCTYYNEIFESDFFFSAKVMPQRAVKRRPGDNGIIAIGATPSSTMIPKTPCEGVRTYEKVGQQ